MSPSGLAPNGRTGNLAVLREAMRYRWSATVTADGFPFASGTRIDMYATAFLRVRNGLIVAIDELLGLTKTESAIC